MLKLLSVFMLFNHFKFACCYRVSKAFLIRYRSLYATSSRYDVNYYCSCSQYFHVLIEFSIYVIVHFVRLLVYRHFVFCSAN